MAGMSSVKSGLVHLKSGLEHLFSGYFAAVMATGIVSVALWMSRVVVLSDILFSVAVAAYAVLIALYAARWVWFPTRVWSDLTTAPRVNGYFTFVAGTNVIAIRFALAGDGRAALILGCVGLIAWLVLTYFTLMVMIFLNRQPVDQVMDGGWLIVPVSTESIATVTVALAPRYGHLAPALLSLGLVYWMAGILLYCFLMGLILYRLLFFPVRPADLGPPNWINMGATAISTLAGAHLVLMSNHAALGMQVRPFVEGLTLCMWTWGTWWIPLLILIGIWKHGVHRERFRYEPSLWSMVFPLGMYASATGTLSRLTGLHFLRAVLVPGTWIAVAAWAVVGLGYLSSWRRRPRIGRRQVDARQLSG
ncbi:MAG: tellurite resistance/C4-dicarboxylate transporter family protein [Alicyclobacillus sp.]|nr:tellurite resistance/C4-dicarboxylate transporter family protein [Alicyclobacillus sp.]